MHLYIDPGPSMSGFVIIKDGILVDRGKLKNSEIIEIMHKEVIRGMTIELPVAYSKFITLSDTLMEVGKFVYVFENWIGFRAIKVPRSAVISSLKRYCGFKGRGKFGDKQIRQAIQQWNHGVKLANDEWSAYALYMREILEGDYIPVKKPQSVKMRVNHPESPFHGRVFVVKGIRWNKTHYAVKVKGQKVEIPREFFEPYAISLSKS